MPTENINSSTSPWEPQQQFLTRGFQRAEDLYNTGGPTNYGQSSVQPLGDRTNQALDMYTNQALDPSLQNATAGQFTGTLNGDYLTPGSNPFLQGQFDDAASQVTRHYQEAVAPGIQSQFANSGRTGSGLYANAMDSSRDTLSRNLGGMANNFYGQNFQNERNRQMSALGMSPQIQQGQYTNANALLNVGETIDDQAQQQLNDQIQRHRFEQERPFDNLARYNAAISGGNYGSQSSQEQYVPSGLQQGLGLGLTGLGIASGISQAGGLGGILGGLF